MSDDIIRWVTVRGLRVPIKRGKSFEESLKEKQMAVSREEAEKLNAEEQLPKRVPMSNIKITKDNIDDKRVLSGVKDEHGNRPMERRKFDFVQGSEIRDAYAFCGKGSSKVFRNADYFADQYPQAGAKEEWTHCAGKALITDGSRKFVREVHWVQGSDGVIREAFIKFRGGRK